MRAPNQTRCRPSSSPPDLARPAGNITPKADEDTAEPAEYVPAVTARQALASPDRIISMINGKSYRTDRRHLSTQGLSPAEYRIRYKLRHDNPMVAPAYSEARPAIAQKIGHGRRPTPAVVTTPSAAPAPARKPRPSKADRAKDPR